MRYSTTLKPIERQMPILKGTDIAIMFYQFANYGDISVAHHYVNEAIRAYHQLLCHSNIADCGRVVFFCDRLLYPVAGPLYAAAGLLESVIWRDVGKNQNMAGYIGLFDHPHVADCRYVFQLDSDMWLMNFGKGQLDFKAVTAELDTIDDAAIFGREDDSFEDVEKSKQFYYRYGNLNQPVKAAMQELFRADVPPVRRNLIGVFTGIRSITPPASLLKAFHDEYGDVFLDDQACYSVFLSVYRNIKTADILSYIPWKGVPQMATGNELPELCLFHVGSPVMIPPRDEPYKKEVVILTEMLKQDAEKTYD